MPKLWIASDLHLEYGGDVLLPPVGADIAVIAGDVVNDTYLAMLAKILPTVYVAGNHDFYGHTIGRRLDRLMSIPNLHLLENQQVVLGGITFLGTTLWTDYAGGNSAAMDLADRAMSDHREIFASGEPLRRFRPRDALIMHHAARFMLEDYFSDRGMPRGPEPTVVVTHHAPSNRSVHPRYAGQPLNHAFYSDLDDVVEASGATLWVHGHMHNVSDYLIGQTRVICNPRGYPGELTGFDPGFWVEVEGA